MCKFVHGCRMHTPYRSSRARTCHFKPEPVSSPAYSQLGRVRTLAKGLLYHEIFETICGHICEPVVIPLDLGRNPLSYLTRGNRIHIRSAHKLLSVWAAMGSVPVPVREHLVVLKKLEVETDEQPESNYAGRVCPPQPPVCNW